MCGIAGIVLTDGLADPAVLDRMVQSLNHRGPDGVSIDVAAGFGHTTSSIIFTYDIKEAGIFSFLRNPVKSPGHPSKVS